MKRFTPTFEQKAVIESKAHRLVVKAFAGAGKTSMLEALARTYSDARILYVSFSKAVADAAQKRFPGNVTCMTMHAVAFASVGVLYRKANKLRGVTVSDIMEFVGVNAGEARTVLSTLENFLHSRDETILAKHVPASVSGQHLTKMVHLAIFAWSGMKDLSEPGIGMSHDGYLKLFQLGQPNLSKDFDLILLDEAQDTNPVVLDILVKQSARLIFVGDEHQSIFLFRHAINAMQQLAGAEQLSLTQSFRFGQGVANLATAILARFKGETTAITGLGQQTATVDPAQPYAFIARTNGTLFKHAVSLLGKTTFHFVGGLENYPFSKLVDVHHILTGNTRLVKDTLLARFANIDTLRQYASDTDDKEIHSLISVAKHFGDRTPELVQQITLANIKSATNARVQLVTGHRSKGLEFDQVILADDFDHLVSENGQAFPTNTPERAQEINLLYVSATRALRALRINAQLQRALDLIKAEQFAVPTPKHTPRELTTAEIHAAIKNAVAQGANHSRAIARLTNIQHDTVFSHLTKLIVNQSISTKHFQHSEPELVAAVRASQSRLAQSFL